MSFFSSILNKIKASNIQQNTFNAANSYMFGVILSGSYSNWKKDPHPTFLCLGKYMKPNGKIYVHGIQLHSINASWVMNLIKSLKQRQTVISPLIFFNYIKMTNPAIIEYGYRTYRIEYCNFKIVNPGLTNIKVFYKPDDQRDSYLNIIAPTLQQKVVSNIEQLKTNIAGALNSFKVWN